MKDTIENARRRQRMIICYEGRRHRMWHSVSTSEADKFTRWTESFRHFMSWHYRKKLSQK